MTNQVPEGLIVEDEGVEAWIGNHSRHMAWMDELEENDAKEWLYLESISPNYAEESYTLSTAKECADMLEEIRASGLNVPQYAIDELRQEAKEEQPL